MWAYLHDMVKFISTGDEAEDEKNLKMLAENIH